MIDIDGKKVLDVTCGSRTIWFNKSAAEARACPLKRAFDHMQMLDTCDNPACWYRAD